MSTLSDVEFVNYNNQEYAVVSMTFKGDEFPLILDKKIYQEILKLDQKWYVNGKGYVYAMGKEDDGVVPQVYIYEIVKKIDKKLNKTKLQNKSIIHKNKVPFDNRLSNLSYNDPNTIDKKNLHKKARTLILPKNSKIKKSELPTFLWYLKSNGTHGDRFFLSFGDVSWKSTSSQKVSLRYKLEESKKYMRYLRDKEKKKFSKYSMNGDFNEKGNELLSEYYKIAKRGGFDDIDTVKMDGNTEQLLKEKKKGLSSFEKYLIDQYDPLKPDKYYISKAIKSYNEKFIKKYQKKIRNMRYCFFVKGEQTCNGYFYIKNHPECKKWYTSKSKYKSIKNKYKQLLDYYDELN